MGKSRIRLDGKHVNYLYVLHSACLSIALGAGSRMREGILARRQGPARVAPMQGYEKYPAS